MNTKTPVKNFMSDKVVVANLQTKFSKIQELFVKFNVHHVPVVYDEQLVGIISTKDTARFLDVQLQKGSVDYASLDASFSVENEMTHKPKYLTPTSLMKEAVEIIAEGKFHAVPVIEDGKVVGIITNNDLVSYLAFQYKESDTPYTSLG